MNALGKRPFQPQQRQMNATGGPSAAAAQQLLLMRLRSGDLTAPHACPSMERKGFPGFANRHEPA